MLPLYSYLKSRKISVTGIANVALYPLAVCKNIQILRNKFFKGLANRGKSIKGILARKLFEELLDDGIQHITNVKSNMKNKLLTLHDKLLHKKRFVIETINDQLKNTSDIEHSRHRSPVNFMLNLIAGLTSYTEKDKKTCDNDEQQSSKCRLSLFF